MRSPRVKYLLCPGVVVSQVDGQRHYIGAFHLAELYGVAPNDCAIYEPEPWWPASFYENAIKRNEGLIPLAPQADGIYNIDVAIKASKGKK